MHPTLASTTATRVTASHAQDERQRDEKPTLCTERRHRRARTRWLCRL